MRKQIFLAIGLMLASSGGAFAQVERAAVRTNGISCGTCAAVSEVYLRKLGSFVNIQISKSQEAVMVTYKPGAAFRPGDIRDALSKTDVSIVQFQISARGQLQEQSGKRIFVAGKDTFVILPSNGPAVPAGASVVIDAILNDRTNPMELKVLAVRPAGK